MSTVNATKKVLTLLPNYIPGIKSLALLACAFLVPYIFVCIFSFSTLHTTPHETATGESLMTHLDDEAVSPILVWDSSCRDRLSALAWSHWEDWRRRRRVGASLRWVPAYLQEEVLLPAAHASEPCVAGLYFRLYAAEPGFALEKDMVEGFLVCSVEVR